MTYGGRFRAWCELVRYDFQLMKQRLVIWFVYVTVRVLQLLGRLPAKLTEEIQKQEKAPEDTKYSFSQSLWRNSVFVRIADQYMFALVDTGATFSVISLTCLQRINRSIKIGKDKKGWEVGGFCGETQSVLGTVKLQVSFDGIKVLQEFRVLERLPKDAILGLDFLKDNKALINFEKKKLTIYKKKGIHHCQRKRHYKSV